MLRTICVFLWNVINDVFIMITEDYVSFETAKLLKEKGFDEYYPLWYNLDKPIEGPFFYKEIGWYGHNSYDYNGKRIVSAPTLQMAMKWLREVHDIDVSVVPLRSHEEYLPRIEGDITSHDDIPCRKYEEACEVAIKYCLENLI